MSASRRDFLRLTGAATVAAGLAAAGILAAGRASPAGKVTRSGTSLVMNGSPFRMLGFNIWNAAVRSWNLPAPGADAYQMGTRSNFASCLADIQAGAPHVNAVRAWFVQQFALIQLASGAYHARDWDALDKVLSVADAAGLKVIAVLQDNWSYEYTGTQGTGLPPSWYSKTYKNGITSTAWETIPYRQWVKAVVTRYAGDPRVLMWEPGTELNGMTSSFISDITGLIRSIDPLTPIGSGSAAGGINADFDCCSYHFYTDYGQTAYTASANAAASIGRCAYVGEAGFDSSIDHTTRASDFNNLMSGVFAIPNEVGFLAWQYAEAAGDRFDIAADDPMLPVLDSYHL